MVPSQLQFSTRRAWSSGEFINGMAQSNRICGILYIGWNQGDKLEKPEQNRCQITFPPVKSKGSAADQAWSIRCPPFRLPAPHEPASLVVAVTAIALVPPVQTPICPGRAWAREKRLGSAG